MEDWALVVIATTFDILFCLFCLVCLYYLVKLIKKILRKELNMKTLLSNVNNGRVKEHRKYAESNFRYHCEKKCENKDYPECSNESGVFRNYCIMQNTASCSASCIASARDWRSAEYKFAGSSIINNIVGGLFITTANILDGILGGIGLMIKGGASNSVDITIFNDVVLKMGLYYDGWFSGYNDILNKKEPKNGWDKSYYRIEDCFRILANIFVVIVFLCLAIRILSLNFKNGVFSILFSEA